MQSRIETDSVMQIEARNRALHIAEKAQAKMDSLSEAE